MNNVMNGILSRLLSGEIGNQERWAGERPQDIEFRQSIVEDIKKFMEENDIEFRQDYYFEAKYQ